MTKKIFHSILLVAGAVLLASLLFIMGCLYEYFGSVEKKQLRDELELASVAVEGGGEDIAEQYNRKEDAVRLYCYLDSELKEQEKQVLLLRYGLGGKAEYTQKQVAARLGISRSYVSRIEKNAIEKLRLRFAAS